VGFVEQTRSEKLVSNDFKFFGTLVHSVACADTDDQLILGNRTPGPGTTGGRLADQGTNYAPMRRSICKGRECRPGNDASRVRRFATKVAADAA